MEIHVYWIGAIVAGIVGMIPGAIIYAPSVLGKVWAKEVGHKMGQGNSKDAQTAMVKMLISSIITGLFMSMVFWYVRPNGIVDGAAAGIVLSWFPLGFATGAVFFEGKSWLWFKISALTQITTFAVMGAVLSLFV